MVGYPLNIYVNDLLYRPYKSKVTNLIYNLFFCDRLKLYQDNFKGEMVSPWSELFLVSKNSGDLENIVNESKGESRVRILAFKELGRLGIKIQKKELLGVIVEVGMDSGLDTLAAYKDNTACYINHTGKMIIWENAQDININDKIMELFRNSVELVSKIGPWDKNRLPQPKKGEARITFLVSDGLYFGQGGYDALLKDPLGGRVLSTASELMSLLINKSLAK